MIAVGVGVLWGLLAGWLTLRQLCAASVRWYRSPDGDDRDLAPTATRPSHTPSHDSWSLPSCGATGATPSGRADGVGYPTVQSRRDPAGRLVSLVGSVVSAVGLVGRAMRRLVGRSPDPAADRRCGAVVVLAGVLVAVHPLLAVVPLAGATVGPALVERRRARQQISRVVDELPDVVDLLRLTTTAGLPVTAAVSAIGGRPGGVVGVALVRAAAQVARGGTTADTLASLLDALGPPIRPLVDALADHDRYGTALAPALDRLSVETRLQRRRQAEEAARRLPVSLLFPLVLTVLPAYVLLTIVPLLVGSFSSLHL
jgi:tight adherence protein C